MNIARRLAARGYGYYLALKIAKAAWCPFAALLMPLVIAFYIVVSLLMTIWEWLAESFRDVLAVARDFRSRRWFSGFSRAHYESLIQYQRTDE